MHTTKQMLLLLGMVGGRWQQVTMLLLLLLLLLLVYMVWVVEVEEAQRGGTGRGEVV